MATLAYLVVYSGANLLVSLFSAAKTGSKMLGLLVALLVGAFIVPAFDLTVTQTVFHPQDGAAGEDIAQFLQWALVSTVVVFAAAIGVWAIK